MSSTLTVDSNLVGWVDERNPTFSKLKLFAQYLPLGYASLI